jgi:colicin import membrane protein
MTETSNKKSHAFPETKWGPMMALSVAFHLGIFLAIIFVPDSIPARNIRGVVYEVDLVTLPSLEKTKSSTSSSKSTKLKVPSKKKTTKSRRISVPKKDEKALIVAKRTLKTKKIKPKPKRLSSTQLIDRAISKIEEQVKKEDQEKHVERAIRELEKKESGPANAGPRGSGGSAVEGISRSIYRAEVYTHIRSNWSYPTALSESKNLEAIVVIHVKNNGKIINFRFKKYSDDQTFNDSVLKAIERSDPLPPFPEIYRRSDEEIEVNFNIKDLET